ncbi:SPFH domain-containing protein [Megasphaera sp.]
MWGQMKERFTFGGDTGKDQRVYYFNMKELIGNKYGTPQEVPFKMKDPDTGQILLIRLRCFGEYSYHIVDPALFYTNVASNVADRSP